MNSKVPEFLAFKGIVNFLLYSACSVSKEGFSQYVIYFVLIAAFT